MRRHPIVQNEFHDQHTILLFSCLLFIEAVPISAIRNDEEVIDVQIDLFLPQYYAY